MNRHSVSNISQVLKCFQRFCINYENLSWPINATAEDIKSMFKLGIFIEKTIATFKTGGFLVQFLLLLEIWGKNQNVHIYCEEFYTIANDYLLLKLFKFPNIKETILDIGVRVYTSLYTKERFKECIKNFILKSSSLAAIAEYVNDSISGKSTLENNLILNQWIEYGKLGHKESLKSEIETYLSSYHVEEKLPKLIDILANNKLNNEINELIFNCILSKMIDRSLLSKNFWLSLFKKVNNQHLTKFCKNYPIFLEYLLNFIEYIGGMMKRNNLNDFCDWTSDSAVSFCHEISYIELIICLKTLCCDDNLKECVLNRLEQVKEYSFQPELWNEIKNDIS